MSNLNDTGHEAMPNESHRTFDKVAFETASQLIAEQLRFFRQLESAQLVYGQMTRMFLWVESDFLYCESFFDSSIQIHKEQKHIEHENGVPVAAWRLPQ